MQTSTRGTLYISDEGVEIIKAVYAEKYTPTILNTTAPPSETSKTNRILDYLVKQIDGLVSQLEQKDKKLEELQKLLKEQTSQIKAQETHLTALKIATTKNHEISSKFSQSAVDSLTKQLKIKDKQIQDLQDSLRNFTTAILNAQKAAAERNSLPTNFDIIELDDNDYRVIAPILQELESMDKLLNSTKRGN